MLGVDIYYINIIYKMSTGKLLLISDIEGCFVGNGQSTPIMCEQRFYTALSKFLDENTGNHVAFLGDYFDMGNLVEQSIAFIVELKKKYLERVHIILGNRDVNKLRFLYETKLTGAPLSKTAGWGVWKGFYDGFESAADKIDIILMKSMGVDRGDSKGKPSYKESLIQMFDYVSPMPDATAAATPAADATAVMPPAPPAASTGPDITFILNVRYLFENANIVEYLPTFKTLISHAGGIDVTTFPNDTYYANLKASLTEEMTYFDKIEIMRQGLQRELREEEKNTGNIDSILTTINSPLKNTLEYIKTDNTKTPCPDYYLLQALGLKPDVSKIFNSFVQSCDVNGCSGPHIRTDSTVYTAYLQKLYDFDVKVVAAGHIAHCAPVPLIYKRDVVIKNKDTGEDERKGIFIIANDTSTGYRPELIKELNQIPLSYVVEGGETAGIMSLGKYGETSADDNTSAVEKFPNVYSDKTKPPGITNFKIMWNEWNITWAPRPTFNRTNNGTVVYIDYIDKTDRHIEKLVFNKGFDSATIQQDKKFNVGGKRKTKKINKNRSKKNKKSKCRFCNH